MQSFRLLICFVTSVLLFSSFTGCSVFYRTYHVQPAEFASQVEATYVRRNQDAKGLASNAGYCALRVNRLRCKDEGSGRMVNQHLTRWSGRFGFVQGNGKTHWAKAGDIYVFNDDMAGYKFVIEGNNEGFRAVGLEDIKFRRSRGWTGVFTFGISTVFYSKVPPGSTW